MFQIFCVNCKSMAIQSNITGIGQRSVFDDFMARSHFASQSSWSLGWYQVNIGILISRYRFVYDDIVLDSG